MQCVGSSSGVQSYSDVAHSAPCSSPLCSFACRRAASFPVANGTFRPSSLKERSKSESEALNRFDYRFNTSFIDLVPLHLWQQKVHTSDPAHSSSSDSEDDASSGVSSSDAADDNVDYLGFEFTDKDGFATQTIVSTGRPKKSVRFADDCGGNLETVRVMTEPSDYPPRISPSVLRRLRGESGDHALETQICASWIVPFKQPASEYVRFREHLDSGKVALENVLLKNDVCKMTGTIKVVNLAFEKRVFIRITDNGWKNFLDRPATFQPSSSKTYDTFSFDIDIPRNTEPDSKVEFCICYIAAGKDYWDSNDGTNYVLISPPHEDHHMGPPQKNVPKKDVDDAYRLSYDDWTKFGTEMGKKRKGLKSDAYPPEVRSETDESAHGSRSCESPSSLSSDDSVVPDGFLRIALSSDALKQLCGFFGDRINFDEMRETVDLSYAVCFEIYKTASVGISETTKDDEMLAMELQAKLNGESVSGPKVTVPDGFLRIVLSSDALNQLCGFFGDGINIDGMRQAVDLSYALCFEIFKAAIAKSDLSEVTNDDEMIALELQTRFNEEVRERTVYSQHDREAFERLCSEFSDIPRTCIMTCFADTKFDEVATRGTVVAYAEEYRKQSVSNHRNYDVRPSKCDVTNTVGVPSLWKTVAHRHGVEKNEKSSNHLFEDAQQMAKGLMEESRVMYAKCAEFKKQANNVSGDKLTRTGAYSYYMKEAAEYRRQAMELVQNANQFLCDANMNTRGTSIDLHLLNVPNAISLLKMKLSQIDRDPAFRSNRSQRILSVITGYGKSNNGHCRLKPAVVKWLHQHGYKFSYTNVGEIRVECK